MRKIWNKWKDYCLKTGKDYTMVPTLIVYYICWLMFFILFGRWLGEW